MENQKFRNSVDQKKHDHISNISATIMRLYDIGAIEPENFFSGKEINIKSFREFLLVNKYSESYINAKLPKVNFEKRKEEILEHIEVQNVGNPTELVIAIAEYMKGLIKYDIIEAIPQIQSIVDNIVIEGAVMKTSEHTIDNALSLIKQYLSLSEEEIIRLKGLYEGMEREEIITHLYQIIYSKLDQKESVTMGEKEFQLFKEKVNHLADTENLSEKEKISIFMNMSDLPTGFAEKLQKGLFADNHSYKDFKVNFRELIAQEKPEDRSDFLTYFHTFFATFILEDIIQSNGEYELADKLYSYKVGVCRDYSIMMKKIYQELANKLFPNSEVIYVMNHNRNHAYNCLAFENEKGELEYKYFDMTRYINGGNLFIKDEEKKDIGLDSKYEILVKENLDDLRYEIEGNIIA